MNNVMLLLVIIALSGCSLLQKKPPPRPTPLVCDLTAKPDALQLKDTPPTLVMNAETWGYWFNADLYASLAENIQAMRRWMKQSKAVRDKFIACIEAHNSRAAIATDELE